MDATIVLTVNGQSHTVRSDPQRPLLDVLREDLHLTGTKFGCGQGDCGACTVLLDGRPARSCVTPVSAVAGRAVTTIEGVAAGDRLHAVQEAFLAEGAFQCGYCTPGMILSTLALLKDNPRPSDQQIARTLDGHICRCCEYPTIVAAVRRAAGQAAEVKAQ